MLYTIVPDFRVGMPSWAKDAKPYRFIAIHDTEGGTGKAGALGTIQFLIDTAAAREASYHEIWAWENGQLTVYTIVSPTRAAGSINPHPYNPPSQVPPTYSYRPDAFVTQWGGNDTWDPNQICYAVAIAGTRAYVDGLAADIAFVQAAKSRLLALSAQLHVIHLAEHFRFQVDRSDWGTKLTPALGGSTLVPLPYGLPGWPDYARATLIGAEGYAYRIFVNAGKAPANAVTGQWGAVGWPSYARFSYAQASAYAYRIFINNPGYKP